MNDTFTITVPRSVYDDALSPLCSGMAAEIGLPIPKSIKRGRGYTMVYEGLTREQVDEVADYIKGRAETLLGEDTYGYGSDPDVQSQRNTYRAAIKAADKMWQQIRQEA